MTAGFVSRDPKSNPPKPGKPEIRKKQTITTPLVTGRKRQMSQTHWALRFPTGRGQTRCRHVCLPVFFFCFVVPAEAC